MLKVVVLTSCLVFSGAGAYAASLQDTFAQAQQAYKSGQYDAAGELFVQVSKMLAQQGDKAKANAFLNNAAISYMTGKNYPSAIAIYSHMLKNPKALDEATRKKAFVNIIGCYNDTEQFALRAAALENMLKHFPRLPQAEQADFYAQLGDTYRKLEVYHQAIGYYTKAAKLLQKNANPVVLAKVLTGLGLSQGNIGDFTAAFKSLSLANELAKKSKSAQTIAESNSNLGLLYLERGEYPKANELLQLALSEAKKSNLKANEGADENNMGLLLKSSGKYEDAMKRFVAAIGIGQQIGNKRDEAIGLVNRALLYRMTAHLQEARADYRKAEQLFREVNFKEGIAGALLGQGVIAATEDRNFAVALDFYSKALALYSEIGLPRARAETLIQIGNAYKATAVPSRATRDLIFDDEPVRPDIPKSTALKEALKAYEEALALAEQVQSKELLWSAWHGIGYCFFQEGKLDAAYKQYMQAINMVTSLRTSLASVSLLGQYMAKKEDLYNEAREVSAALYDKTKDKKYLEKQMQLDETLRNEISKAALALTQVKYDDPQKQLAYEKLVALGKQQEKAEKAIPVVAAPTKNMTADEKKKVELMAAEAKTQKSLVKKLDGEYAKLLAEWEKKYPEDAVVFESAARVDIKKIQKNLGPDQAVVQYLPLHDKLIIIAISQKDVEQYSVAVSQKELDKIIKKDFLVGYIESYGRGKLKGTEQDEFRRICATLNTLYKYLVQPTEAFIADKKTLYFVASGFLAQVPFVALVKDYTDSTANFLVEKYDISQVRPSFIESLESPTSKESLKTLLAVGNPRNSNIFMADLEGAKLEVENADGSINHDTAIKDIRYEKTATEAWLMEQLKNSQYEYIYFATHAMPFSDVYMSYINNYTKRSEKLKKRFESKPSENPREDPNPYEMFSHGKEYIDSQLAGYSPMNGYLYMQAEKEFAYGSGQKPLSSTEDGLLTIADIMRLDKKSFDKTKVVVLSACNTGVTFAPKTVKNEIFSDVLSAEEVEKTLRDTGWVPGVDQVSFVDVFMRRGVNNVYGTLWFADDKASQYLMSNFMKYVQKAGDNVNVVHEYSQVLRDFIKDCKESKKPLSYDMPIHPYFWAVGSFFGK